MSLTELVVANSHWINIVSQKRRRCSVSGKNCNESSSLFKGELPSKLPLKRSPKLSDFLFFFTFHISHFTFHISHSASTLYINFISLVIDRSSTTFRPQACASFSDWRNCDGNCTQTDVHFIITGSLASAGCVFLGLAILIPLIQCCSEYCCTGCCRADIAAIFVVVALPIGILLLLAAVIFFPIRLPMAFKADGWIACDGNYVSGCQVGLSFLVRRPIQRWIADNM